MRDIKQYFMNGTKIDKKIINSIDNVERMEEEQEDNSVAKDGRKRKRVKIRISRASSKERTCDIIESKNDLIDKTPSPFANTDDSSRISQSETPKSHLASSSAKQDSEKVTVMIGNKSRNMENISQDVNSKISKNTLDKQIVMDLIDLSNDTSIKNVHDESRSNVKFCDDIGSQREESNVFQVLMNRSKPIQYKSPPQQSIEDVKFNEKSDDAKEIKSKHKERLVALADKKGYSKRKLADAEESEKMEKNIENRVKLFKHDNGKNDSTESIKCNRQLSGSLLDYFSKSSLELTNKDIKCVSTFIVKADVHRTETASIEPVLNPISNKIYSIKKCSKAIVDLSEVDDIHVIASENVTSPLTTMQEKRHKPRWSLRIKLHSSEENDTTDDELFSPRSRSRFHTVTNKPRRLTNTHIENNKMQSKHYNEHIKKKVQDEEKNESLDEQKDSNVQMDVTRDSTINNSVNNNEDSDTCLLRSEKVGKMEEIFNDVCETVTTVTDDSECEIINENVLKKKSNEKLAPLFMKRRKIDPAVVAAKRLFLQSDITDTESKTTDRKTNNGIPILPFPVISHVTQLENNYHSDRPQIQHKFPTKIKEKYLPLIDIDEYKCITNYNEASKMTEAIDKPMKGNFDWVLSEMEKRCPDVQKMWKTVSTIKDETEKKPLQKTRGGRKIKTLERKNPLTESVKANQLHDCAWTCKYKPMSAQEVVGNEEAAAKLKDWLSGWRVSLTKDDYSSGDEFYSSDSCSNMHNNENNQTAVLLGPHGSGKSASVYAIAEELGYSVLEVNASSRRTGKRILKELEEATKSHRIKKNKRKSPFEQVAKENDTPEILQNSLILLEDIDLIFEEDEGFVSAAYQLASNTKRPIVMTCRDMCPHLSKMAPQQKKIYFQQVNGNRVSTLLVLISLAETGYRLPHNFLVKLLQMGDLRKALLQLQYLLLSGLPVLSDQSTIVRPSVWQDMQCYLYKPAIKLSKRHKAKKNANAKKSNEQIGDDTVHILSSLADDLDGLSLVSSLINIDDTVLNTPEANAQPNLSLVEKLSLYSASHRSSADIASFLNDRILYKDSNGNKQVQNSSNVVLRNQLNRGVDLALSQVTSACLDRRIMAIDYLPTARAICRAEESRSAGNHKRGNRFFHYLHGLKVPAASMKPNILAAACRTLQEKIDNNASMSNVVNVSID